MLQVTKARMKAPGGNALLRRKRRSLSRIDLQKTAFALMVLYVIAIQLPLLSPYRVVPVDEMQLVDAAYGVSSGRSPVPAGWFWSHVIPETSRYFEAFRPLYLYLLALTIRLFGISVVAVGTLHACLRIMSVALFFLLSKHVTRDVVASAAFSSVWATFALGPVGRFEDLAVALLLTSLCLMLSSSEINRTWSLAGAFAGLTFLTYPGYLSLLPLAVGLAKLPLRPIFADGIRSKILRRLLTFVVVAGCTALLWLFWIVPYWHEFNVHFLEFAVPDALAPSYSASLAALVKYVVAGFLTSPIPFHYSLLPVLGLLSALAYVDARQNGFSFRTFLAIALPLVIGVLTARVRIHKTYNLIWLIAAILVLLPILWGAVFTQERRFSHARPVTRVVIGVLLLAIGFQLVATLLLSGLGIVGDIAAVEACGSDPHAGFINQIPPGDKVITSSAAVFYGVRHQNPVYWPAGLQGETPGGVPFSTHYDDSFRWLALAQPLDEIDLEHRNPGAKFRWDAETLSYFRNHYRLTATSDLKNECDVTGRLTRFSSMPRTLYLYRRN